ncbi:MAG: MATE family efflux transporter [Ruminococcaceae bacterium]|nr:MATE family efflux transporter [Oscillospiraceae bacterium]
MSASKDFSVGSVKRLILSQALPLTLAQTVQLLYNLVDRVYIGHLDSVGNAALTGLGVTFPVIVIIAAFTSLFATGGTTLFSIARGKNDNTEARHILNTVFTMQTVSSIVLFAVCYLFRRPILMLFGAGEQSLLYADAYLQVYLFGTLFSMLSTGMSGFINAQGFPKIGMTATVVGAVINIALDPLFIFAFDMGVRGAALATVVSQAVSMALVVGFLISSRVPITLDLRYMPISGKRLKRIVALGIPGFVVQATNSLVQVVCNNQLQQYGGDLYVGIMTVLGSIREMISLPVLGLSSGAQPVLGFNYGADKPDRVKEGIRFTALIGTVYTLLAWVAVMLLPNALIGLFSEDPLIISIGSHMLNIYFFGFVFMAFQFSGQSTFQALGKAKQAIFFSLLRKVFIVVPFTLLLPAVGFGVEGVFWAEPISNVIGGLAAFLTMWYTVYRKL